MADLIQQLREGLAPYFVSSEHAPPGVYARYKTAAAQSFANNTTAVVDFGTVDFDPQSAVTTGAAWKFTAPFDGAYAVSATILWNGTTTWADAEAGVLALYKNGTLVCYLDRRDSYGSASTVYMMLRGMTTIQLVSGDYIDVRASQTSGGTLTLFNDAMFNYIDIHKI